MKTRMYLLLHQRLLSLSSVLVLVSLLAAAASDRGARRRLQHSYAD
jgi:hypothetical protein